MIDKFHLHRKKNNINIEHEKKINFCNLIITIELYLILNGMMPMLVLIAFASRIYQQRHLLIQSEQAKIHNENKMNGKCVEERYFHKVRR